MFQCVPRVPNFLTGFLQRFVTSGLLATYTRSLIRNENTEIEFWILASGLCLGRSWYGKHQHSGTLWLRQNPCRTIILYTISSVCTCSSLELVLKELFYRAKSSFLWEFWAIFANDILFSISTTKLDLPMFNIHFSESKLHRVIKFRRSGKLSRQHVDIDMGIIVLAVRFQIQITTDVRQPNCWIRDMFLIHLKAHWGQETCTTFYRNYMENLL
jgi:hypothetical protein